MQHPTTMTTEPTPPLSEEKIQLFRQVFEEEAKRIYQERLDELFFGEYAPHLQHQTSNIKHST